MRTHRPGERRTTGRWLVLWLLALLLQIPLYGALVFTIGGEPPPRPERAPTVLSFAGRRVERKPKVEPPDPPLPPDAQVVEVPREEELEQPLPPVKTRFLASDDMRTRKQTRSRRAAPPDKSRRPGRVKVKEPSEVQSKRSESPDPTVTTEQEREKIALVQPPEDHPQAEVGQPKRDSVLFDGRRNQLLLPATSQKAALANVQALSGQFASDDYLPDVAADTSTLLDANRYRFSDFFYRVKEGLRRTWHPDRAYRHRDPTGKIYGLKDRHTVFRVTLDKQGRLKGLVLVKDSGLGFMDDEARGAFERAQPFPNPPLGLVDERGEVVFQFGFFFEITSGGGRFRWKRL